MPQKAGPRAIARNASLYGRHWALVERAAAKRGTLAVSAALRLMRVDWEARQQARTETKAAEGMEANPTVPGASRRRTPSESGRSEETRR
jgi:hypothetical protein